MKQDKIKTLTWAGLMCAIVVVTTMFAAIPIPGVQGAYANAGDAAVYASPHLLGWPWGVAAAAIGSMLADLLLGSALYAPATFVIKGVMALLAVKLAGKVKAMIPRFLICGGAMVLGYFLYECLIYGASTAVYPADAHADHGGDAYSDAGTPKQGRGTNSGQANGGAGGRPAGASHGAYGLRS